jgi:hypothetical protein
VLFLGITLCLDEFFDMSSSKWPPCNMYIVFFSLLDPEGIGLMKVTWIQAKNFYNLMVFILKSGFTQLYSQTSIYVLLYLRTFDLVLFFWTYYSIYVLKFDLRTSLNVLEFDIRTIQSTYIECRSTYIKVRRSQRVTWGLWGISSAGLELSILTLWECWGHNSWLVVIY